ncbi:MAG: hypothetical protein RO469_14660 [Thermincola sp.]|nr:hypothetical protein [Thermincola sp.]MDT3704078.1 hypothetical protein [Thermincola sp.]
MKKIKDRILLGAVSGFLAGLPADFLNKIENKLGLTDRSYDEMASSLFAHKNKSTTGKVLGSFANQTLNCSAGVLTAYTLSATGRDHAVLKGIGVGVLYWFALYGVTSGSGMLPKSKKPLTSLLGFVDHIVGGATIGLAVSRLGDDSLFPDQPNPKPGQKLPLVSTGHCQQP